MPFADPDENLIRIAQLSEIVMRYRDQAAATEDMNERDRHVLHAEMLERRIRQLQSLVVGKDKPGLPD